MLKIAHRGCLNGPNLSRENSPLFITEAINSGFDVEIDLWVYNFGNGNIYLLGHDDIKYKISVDFLYSNKDKLFVHCKNLKALDVMIGRPFRYFFHDKDDYCLVANTNFIWANIGREVNDKTIVVLKGKESPPNGCAGVCSDYISEII